MRGKLRISRGMRSFHGLIPAHAGKTSSSHGRVVPGRAHPRACGENIYAALRELRDEGSSPRMRGKRELADILGTDAEAHPRACGENMQSEVRGNPLRGSSPRMRGKPGGSAASVVQVGLIPAHAGKTYLIDAHQLQPRAHPRACGENRLDSDARGYRQGSSPRMRGKPRLHRPTLICARLIPAHAGKTHGRIEGVDVDGAHPRACGEN